MVKLTMVCLQVNLEGEQGTDVDKAANRQFEKVQTDLQSVGARVCKLDVPPLPDMYALESVLHDIQQCEESIKGYYEQVSAWVPRDQDPDEGFKWALYSVRDVLHGDVALMVDPAILHPGDSLATLLVAVPIPREKEWLVSYPTMHTAQGADGSTKIPMAVPDTAVKVLQDQTHALYAIMVVPSAAQGVAFEAQRRGFNVRQVVRSRQEHELLFSTKTLLLKEEQEAKDDLGDWCTINAQAALQDCRFELLGLRAVTDSMSRFGIGSRSMTFVVAASDPSIDRDARKVLERIAGSKHVLTEEDMWRTFFKLGLGDGSHNCDYLSVPFKI
ncbi:hypothetical protein ACQ4PT_063290 [Festuca glaucescens]